MISKIKYFPLISIFDDSPCSTHKISRFDIIIIFLFFLLSLIMKEVMLLGSDYANGSDAYVYIIQMKSIVENGNMHFKDSSLIYPFLSILSLIIKNYILALKTGISILTGFFVISVYLLSFQITGERWNSVFISLAALFSPSLVFFAVQFPKNFMGLVFFFFLILFCLKKNLPSIVLFFILTFVTHRLMAGFSILFILSFIILSLRSKYVVLSFLVILCSGIILSLVLPGTIHFYDFERFADLFTLNMTFAPYAFFNLMGWDKIHFLWKVEIIVYYLLLILSVILLFYKYIKKENISRCFFTTVILLVITVFPFFLINSTGMGFRFFMLFVPVSLVACIYLSKNLDLAIIQISSALLLISAVFIFFTLDISKFDPPYRLYERISLKSEKFLKEKKPSLLVAHKPLAEMMDYNISKDVLPWEPEDYFDKKTTWRIVADIEIWEIELKLKKLENGTIQQLTSSYLIIREDIWNKFRNRLIKKDNIDLYERVYSLKNPHRKRPAYLKRFKKKRE